MSRSRLGAGSRPCTPRRSNSADEAARLHAENVELRKRLDRLERALAVETKQRKALGAGIVPVIFAIGDAVTDLGKRPVYEWKGPHVEGTVHNPGHLTQRGGNVSLCVATTTGTPGKCEDFCLFVRSGRDGRDLMREPVIK